MYCQNYLDLNVTFTRSLCHLDDGGASNFLRRSFVPHCRESLEPGGLGLLKAVGVPHSAPDPDPHISPHQAVRVLKKIKQVNSTNRLNKSDQSKSSLKSCQSNIHVFEECGFKSCVSFDKSNVKICSRKSN